MLTSWWSAVCLSRPEGSASLSPDGRRLKWEWKGWEVSHSTHYFLLCGWGEFGKCLQKRPKKHRLACRLRSLCFPASCGGGGWGSGGARGAAQPPPRTAISQYQPAGRNPVGAAHPLHILGFLSIKGEIGVQFVISHWWGRSLLTTYCCWGCRLVQSYSSRERSGGPSTQPCGAPSSPWCFWKRCCMPRCQSLVSISEAVDIV